MASGCSNSALAYCTLKGGGGALLTMNWLAFFRSFSASLSVLALMYAAESTEASILTVLNSNGRKSYRFFFLRAISDINGT